ncbi:MAG: hypothetical protein NC930_05795 [Candidatus Omnitrophica bacterium]|nr:hypothetical protein [Candidatus Omnitrophota bacterium]
MMKLKLLLIGVLTIALLGIASESYALLDYEIYTKNRNSELQETRDQVRANGSAPTGLFSKEFDTNKDGVIDRTEAEAIETVLGVNVSPTPAATVPPPAEKE